MPGILRFSPWQKGVFNLKNRKVKKIQRESSLVDTATLREKELVRIHR